MTATEQARRARDTYARHIECRALYADVDRNLHINNQALGRIFEEGRVDLNRHVFAQSFETTRRLSFFLVNINITFIAETHYPGVIEIGTSVSRIGTTSFGLAQAAFQNGACVATADAVLVKVVDRTPAPLSENERSALRAVLVDGT